MRNDDAAAFAECFASYRARANRALERYLPAADAPPAHLHEAMRYAVLSGGKRVRAGLVYAAGEALGAEAGALERPAAAVELVHAYSLVHDDLPAMDDDDLRRGKPTCHKAFGEANALLAGDALQSLAFEVLCDADPGAVPPTPECRVEMARTLARAAGSLGMAGGQAIDLASVGKVLDVDELERMHRHKTGALICASVRLGALAAVAPGDPVLQRLEDYAICVGLAFQIRDDVLDVEGDTETLGKTRGSDIARDKPTYPALLGLEAAKRKAEALHEQALAELADLGAGADPLRWLSAYVVSRSS